VEITIKNEEDTHLTGTVECLHGRKKITTLYLKVQK
jgi:hypothetical protein